MEQIIHKLDNPDSGEQTIVPKRRRISSENIEPMLIEDEHCVLPESGSNDCVQTVAKTSRVILPKEHRERLYASYLECQKDEIKFLEHPSMKGHPNLVSIMGYSEEGKEMGVVYDLDPLDTLRSLISKGSLNWSQTFKIALELAQLLAWLHDFGYLVRNLAPAHIIIDKNFKPRLVDFMMLTGGIMGDRISRERGYWSRPLGYGPPGRFSEAYDVYVYGQILISLIAKKVYVPHVPDSDKFSAVVWAKKAYNERGGSFLHESLQEEIDDITEERITELAMNCIADKGNKRPKMEEIVKTLLKIKSAAN